MRIRFRSPRPARYRYLGVALAAGTLAGSAGASPDPEPALPPLPAQVEAPAEDVAVITLEMDVTRTRERRLPGGRVEGSRVRFQPTVKTRSGGAGTIQVRGDHLEDFEVEVRPRVVTKNLAALQIAMPGGEPREVLVKDGLTRAVHFGGEWETVVQVTPRIEVIPGA